MNNKKIIINFCIPAYLVETELSYPLKLCIIKEQNAVILYQNQNRLEAGHLVIAKIIKGITNMFRVVRNSQKTKPIQQKATGQIGPPDVCEPWQWLTLDISCLLPTFSNKKKYIVIIQDRFTKLMELCPLCRVTATTIS